MIAFAVIFLVVLFLLKSTSVFKNSSQTNGLAYENATVGDLVNKDTDGDGIADWEEGLWGTDPTKKETTPGIPDSTTIAKLKINEGNNLGSASGYTTGPENLTETDKFSRELFSTVAALNQGGTINQATADQISGSLADKIKNSTPRKVYVSSDIKVIKNDLYQTIRTYGNTLNIIYQNSGASYTAMDVLQKFIVDQNTIDSSVLIQLDPIIAQINKVIVSMTGMSVPESLASLHLDILNGMEKISENLNDIKLYDTDPVLALGGISQYQTNATAVQISIKNLSDTLAQKLNN